MLLENRVAVITGAGRGIGPGIALRGRRDPRAPRAIDVLVNKAGIGGEGKPLVATSGQEMH